MPVQWDDFEAVEQAEPAPINWDEFEAADKAAPDAIPSPPGSPLPPERIIGYGAPLPDPDAPVHQEDRPKLPLEEQLSAISPQERAELERIEKPSPIPVTIGRTGKALSGLLADIGEADDETAGKPWSEKFKNTLAGISGEKQPIETTMENIQSPAISFPYKVSSGLVEVAPKMAAVSASGPAAPLTAGYLFGYDDEGNFHPAQAAIAAALPLAGKWGGQLSVKVAQAMKVSSPEALGWVNAGGGYATANAIIAAQTLPGWSQMDDNQKQDAVAGLLVNGLLGLTDLHGPQKAGEVFKESAEKAAAGEPPPIMGSELNMPPGARRPPGPPGQKFAQPVEVPGTPAEENEPVLRTIRKAGANTTRKVQELFPERGLSREEAATLRRQAFPETVATPPPEVTEAGKTAPKSAAAAMEAIEQAKAENIEQPTSNIEQPSKGKEPDASGEQKTAEVHGAMQPQPGEGEGEVPAKEGGPGIQSPAEAQAGEVALTEPKGYQHKEFKDQPNELITSPAPPGLTLEEMTKESPVSINKRLSEATGGKASGTVAAYWAAIHAAKTSADPVGTVRHWASEVRRVLAEKDTLMAEAKAEKDPTKKMDILQRAITRDMNAALPKEGLEAIASGHKDYGLPNEVANAAREELGKINTRGEVEKPTTEPQPKEVTKSEEEKGKAEGVLAPKTEEAAAQEETRPVPTYEQVKELAKTRKIPTELRYGSIAAWNVNEETLKSGKFPNGKKTTAAEIAKIQADQKHIVALWKNFLGDTPLPKVAGEATGTTPAPEPEPTPPAETNPPQPPGAEPVKTFTLENIDVPDADLAKLSSTPPTKKLRIQKNFLGKAVDEALKGAPMEKTIPTKQRQLLEKARELADKTPNKDIAKEISANTAAIRAEVPHVQIEVPGDGIFTLVRTREALNAFKETVRKDFPTSAGRAPMPSLPRGTATPVPKLGTGTAEDAIKAAGLVADPDDSRLPIQVIYGNGSELVASDGKRMTRVLAEGHGTQEKPVQIDPETGKSKPWDYQERAGRFPAYNQIIPKDNFLIGTVKADDFWKLAKKAEVMTTDKQFTVGLYRNPDGSFGISAKSDLGETQQNLKDNAEFVGLYHPQYLMDAAESALRGGDENMDVYAGDWLTPVVFQGKKTQTTIMPVRGSEGIPPKVPWGDLNLRPANPREFPKAVEPFKPEEEPPPKKKGPGIVGMGGAVESEFSLPTIEDQISGKGLAPAREKPTPLEEPAQQSTLQEMTQAVKNLGESVKGWLGGVAGKTFPRTTLKSRQLGELGARWISSQIAAKPKAEVFAADVLGNSGIEPRHLGAALTEDNLRSIKQAFNDKADEAENRHELIADLRGELENLKDMDAEDPAIKADKQKAQKEIARLKALTDEDVALFRDKANAVQSFIGTKNFPFKTEEEYQAFLDNPKTQEAVERHKSLWQAVVEPQYKEAMGLDPDLELPSRGLQTGARINLRAVLENETGRDVVRTANRGNLLGTLRKKSPFGVRAKGTGEAYHVNYYDLMENTFGKQLEIANKNAFERALVDEGQAVIAPPGESVTIEGQPAVPFPLKRQRIVYPGGGGSSRNEMLYVNKKLAREYRIAANVDMPPPPVVVRGVAHALNTSALAGATDATTHVLNQVSTLATLPGASGRLLHDTMLSIAPGRPDIFVAVGRALAKGFRDNRAQLASLAEIGALRAHEEPTGIPGLRQLSQLVHWMDKTTRLALDDAYKRLAADNLVENSETARREFVNQVGQYNKRAQSYYKRWFRDTGLGPFVTAGTTFNTLGVRAVTLNPGVKTTTLPAAIAVRANMLAKLAGTAATVAIANYLLTKDKGGGVLGRPGIPLGDIDLGTDDKNGRPNRIAIFSMIGPGRGMRVTGARGFIQGKMLGLPTGTAMQGAERDMINSAFSPWAGPPVKFLTTAATGHATAVDVPRVSPVVPPGQNQFASNLREAMVQANPVVAGVKKGFEPGSTGWTEALKSQLPRFIPQPGKPPEMMKDYPGIVRRAQANTFIEDVIARARKMEPEARRAYLLDQVNRLEQPQDRQKAMKEFHFRKVL